MIYKYTYNKEKIFELLDVGIYHTYLFDYKKRDILSRFIEIGRLFNSEKFDDKSLMKHAEDMFSVFESVMSEKYKLEIIDEASIKQKEYEESNIQKTTKEKIEKIITDKFNSLFGDLNGTILTRSYKKVQVMRCLDYTAFLGENLRNAYSDYPFVNFMGWMVNELKQAYGVEEINRDEVFKSDLDFRNYLEQNNYDILIGSSYAFCNNDYEDYRKDAWHLHSRAFS